MRFGFCPLVLAAVDLAAEPASAPQLKSIDTISSGDTAWILVCVALVLMMTIPGLAMFYAGMVRKVNILSIGMQCIASVCIVTLLWVALGYSLAFMPGSQFVGCLDRIFLLGLSPGNFSHIAVHPLALTIPEILFAIFQLTLAIMASALITGAIAERMKFSAFLLFIVFWSLLVYSPIVHMIWEPSGLFAKMGILDFAGGTVMHINAGIAGLMCVLELGNRIDYNKYPIQPYNLTLSVIGVSLLWVGWFGLNAGSAYAANGQACYAMGMTQIAASASAITWMLIEWSNRGVPTILGFASGIVAGLVAITPACGYVDMTGALVIGLVSGAGCYLATSTLKKKFKYDDTLNVFGLHCIGGIIGVLLVGVLNDEAISGKKASIIVQIFAVLFTLIYSGGVSFVILKIIKALMGLRVTEEQEREGLDIALHGESLV